MSNFIQIELTEKTCPWAGDYAEKHSTSPPKTAVISCDGACLRGEISRRASNIIANELAPNKAVRICNGGFLETGGGMKKLVELANQVLVLDGCFLTCASRIIKGAYPNLKPNVIITDKLFKIPGKLFAVDELPESDIQTHAYNVAVKVIKDYINTSYNVVTQGVEVENDNCDCGCDEEEDTSAELNTKLADKELAVEKDDCGCSGNC